MYVDGFVVSGMWELAGIGWNGWYGWNYNLWLRICGRLENVRS